MKFEMLGKTWNHALKNNTGLLISNVLLAGALAVSVAANMSNRERLVIIPPYLDGKMEIGWNGANSEYLKSFGLYLSVLVGNITPKNAKFVTDSLSSYLAPDIYSEARGQLLSFLEDPQFRQGGFIVTFQPDKVLWEPKTNRVFVTGNSISTVLGQKDTFARQITYEMDIVVRAGRPLVRRMLSYTGLPRTEEVLFRSAAEDKAKADKERQIEQAEQAIAEANKPRAVEVEKSGE